MTDNLAVPLAGAFDALDLAIPTKPPTLDPDCHEACGCRPPVVETCVSMQRMLGHACAGNDVGHLRRSVGASPLVAHRSATPGAKSMRMGGPVRNESHHGPGLSCWSAMFDQRVATRTS